MSVWLFSLGYLAFSAMCSAYPLYGPKRLRTYSPMSYPPIYSPRTPRQYYYDPYGQDLTEMMDMYPAQDPYDRYRYYQVPYYFPEGAPYYYDDDTDIADELDDERLEDLALGGQQWYNKQDGNAKANAYFLQNLILAQMYKDAEGGAYGYPDEEYVYGEPVLKDSLTNKQEDEDVTQLKSLTKDSPKRQQRQQAKKKPEKPQFPDNTWTEKRSDQGEEEVDVPRPVPFRQRVHEPSAYDAIKKLLQVQSQQNKRESGSRQPQKRSYIPNEDALVEQLGSLKKSA